MAFLELQKITKRFGDTHVLKGVSATFAEGTVTAVLGANGAGKSTLMKILCGQENRDSGQILLNGKGIQFGSPQEATKNGIALIPQELGLLSHLSVEENLALGRESNSWGFIRNKEQRKRFREVLSQLGLEKLNLTSPVSEHTPGVQQLIAIARALLSDAQILLFDEPTSMLTEPESQRLFHWIRSLKAAGKTVVYITHRLNELPQFADDLLVLRNGVVVGKGEVAQTAPEKIVEWMVGDFQQTQKNRRPAPKANRAVVLKAQGLTTTKLRGVSLEVRKGEVLGLAGLMGSGRSEILRALACVDPVFSGRIEVNGHSLSKGSVASALQNGVLYSPEDRRHHGLFLDQSVGFNVLAQNAKIFSWLGFLRGKAAEEKSFQSANAMVRVDAHDASQSARTLSGGNQQRLILGKILLNKKGCVYLLDEVTTGVDVSVKKEILSRIEALALAGKSIIFASSDWDEVAQVADRILVVSDGRICDEMDTSAFSPTAALNRIQSGVSA